MENREHQPSAFINIGEINLQRVTEDIRYLNRSIEQRLRDDYSGRPVPEGEIYRQTRNMIVAEMYQFPFFESVETAANLVSLDKNRKGMVRVDDIGLRNLKGTDFMHSAATAIWAMGRELERQGFDYDPEEHPLGETLANHLDKQIAKGFPDELKNEIQAVPPSHRFMHSWDAMDLARLINRASALAYNDYRQYWQPVIDEHRRLFQAEPSSRESSGQRGVGFAIILMEGLRVHTEDEERLLASFNAQMNQLDEEDSFRRLFLGS